jgi:hypothetical protein
MSKQSLESAIREIAEGAESGKPTPKVATPGQPELPSEGGDPGKGGNDPKAKGGVEEPMKDKLLTDPEHKHDAVDKMSDATSKVKARKADKSGGETAQKVKEEEEVVEIEDQEIVAEADETDEDVEIVEVDEDIFELVNELDEEELRARYAELLSAVIEEEAAADEDDSEQIEEEIAEIRTRITAADLDLSEDIDAMFSNEDLSEEFQTKAKTIFEAAVLVQVNNKLDQLEESFKQELSESIETNEAELTNKIDEYLNYVVEEWMTTNELAVERGLRSEIAEEFIGGLQNLFVENYIDVPADKVDVLDELATEIDELKAALNEQIEANIDLKNKQEQVVRESILVDELSELADSQVEKVVALAENVTFEDVDQYREAINILKESYLPQTVETTEDDSDVDEEFAQVIEESEEPAAQLDESMSQYVRVLGSQLK